MKLYNTLVQNWKRISPPPLDANKPSYSDDLFLQSGELAKNLQKLASAKNAASIMTRNTYLISPSRGYLVEGYKNRKDHVATIEKALMTNITVVGSMVSAIAAITFSFGSVLSCVFNEPYEPTEATQYCYQQLGDNLADPSSATWLLGAATVLATTWYLIRHTRFGERYIDQKVDQRVELLRKTYAENAIEFVALAHKTAKESPYKLEVLHRDAEMLKKRLPYLSERLTESANLEKHEIKELLVPLEWAIKTVKEVKV